MSEWKNSLIRAYRTATWPLRRWESHRAKQKRKVPVHILYYHLVTKEPASPWSISEVGFQRHIDWLQNNFDLVSLSEAQRRIRGGNDRPAVAITFDDGYSENCSFALPLLIERRIPVTYFVTTYHTTHNKPFPHDVEQGRPLPTNTIESLRALVNAGVEIGGHTRTHIDLGKRLEESQLFDEVIAATREMESMIDSTIHYFAFPYGQYINLDPRVFKLLEDHGFSGVCSAYGGVNEVGCEAFHLQRIHADPNMERMKNWLGGDPRIRNVQRYDWKQELKTMTTPSVDFDQPLTQTKS
ncbi:MAG: polysaccharide deacetylase family protein [Planctomycetota bacterium]